MYAKENVMEYVTLTLCISSAFFASDKWSLWFRILMLLAFVYTRALPLPTLTYSMYSVIQIHYMYVVIICMHTITPGFLQQEHPYSPLNWLQFRIAAFAGKSNIAHNSLAFTFCFPFPGISISIPIRRKNEVNT